MKQVMLFDSHYMAFRIFLMEFANKKPLSAKPTIAQFEVFCLKGMKFYGYLKFFTIYQSGQNKGHGLNMSTSCYIIYLFLLYFIYLFIYALLWKKRELHYISYINFVNEAINIDSPRFGILTLRVLGACVWNIVSFWYKRLEILICAWSLMIKSKWLEVKILLKSDLGKFSDQLLIWKLWLKMV